MWYAKVAKLELGQGRTCLSDVREMLDKNKNTIDKTKTRCHKDMSRHDRTLVNDGKIKRQI